MRQDFRRPERREAKEFDEQVAQINRVSKKTKGGNRISFSALVVAGDRKGRVGVGLGKAVNVSSAIRKASERARKNLISVPIVRGTIPHEIRIKLGAAKILLKPAPAGTGLVVGGPVRVVASLAGIKNLVAKILGTNNKASNVYATFKALSSFKNIPERQPVKKEA